MTTNRGVLALLARQDGLITLEQAERLGMAEYALRRRLRTAGWERILPRVFLAAGHPFTDRARVRAAGLWAGERAAVSGAAAAWWHGILRQAPVEVDVTVPRSLGLRSRAGVRVRRRDLDPADVLGVAGMWFTDLPLTALETAAALPDGSVFLDRALQKHVRFERVHRAYCRNMGAHGGKRVATLLTACADRADSAAERVMRSILRGAALTGWRQHHPVGSWIVDFAFPEAMVALEVDGWAWHVDVERFRADRRKGNALVRAGWELLRFTWHDLDGRPDHVLAEVRAALAS